MSQLKSNYEWALMYQEAIAAILAGGANVSYSMMGRTFTKASLEGMQRSLRYYTAEAKADSCGNVTQADFSGGCG